MPEINCESNSKMFFDEYGVLTFSNGNETIKIKNDGIHIIDQYGNEMFIKDCKLTFNNNSPSYEELYNHWIKTKEE